MSKYYAVVANQNGQPVRFPFKQWVRDNMDQLPDNFPRDGTTHVFKRQLIGLNWVERVGVDTVYMIQPDENGNVEYASNLVDDLDIEIEENIDEEEQSDELTFGLERDLQRALRRNIQSLEPGLEIIDGGRERHTEAGFIDITARDGAGLKVVIELKAPIAKPDVIAQTLSYMQAVHEEDNVEVRGIIIASDFPERVKLAARQIPNLRLVTYSFQFSFNHVN